MPGGRLASDHGQTPWRVPGGPARGWPLAAGRVAATDLQVWVAERYIPKISYGGRHAA